MTANTAITVILCTYNRARLLERALESVAASVLPASLAWEILIVDNNSRDETPAVAASFARRHRGRVRYLFEARAGKSHALNAGIRDARGRILAFVDDDVTVAPTWLLNLTHSIRAGESVGAGGRILPAWTSTPPAWLATSGPYALAPLAVFDLGEEGGPLKEPPFGTNMAFAREVFARYGEFRSDLGPRPDSELRGEDTEFGRRVLDGGERLRYEPAAVVYHPVPEDRLRREYFLAWWFDKGRANVREFGTRSGSRLTVAGVPLHLVRHLAANAVRWAATFDSPARFRRKTAVWARAGEIAECYQSLGQSTRAVPSVSES